MTSSVSARRSRASRSRRSWWMWLCLTLAPLPFSAIHAQTRSTTACPSGSHADSALSVAARRVDVQPNVPARCLAVPVIDSATPGGHTARTLSDELQGRVAGVTVLESSGIVATGARVRFRGGIGLTLPREPLLVIDGVRVDASQSSPGIDVGGQRPSRLDDIPLDDIDRIAILRGPAASALYGVDAAGGVIEVRTKTGPPGTARWSTYVEAGASTDVTSYPSNWATSPAGTDACTRAGAVQGICTPGPLSSWNPLERASPFHTAPAFRGAANVAGGFDRFRYFAGGTGSAEQGVLEPDEARRYSLRANIDAQPMRSFTVSLRGSHGAGRLALPLGDAVHQSALYAGLLGNSADDPVRRGYREIDPGRIATAGAVQHIARWLGSAAGAWTPLHWLTVTGLAGREVSRRDESRSVNRSFVFADPAQGDVPVSLQGSTSREKRTTLAAGLAATYHVTGSVRVATSVRRERLTTSLLETDSSLVYGLFPPEPSTPATPGASNYRTTREPARAVGTYATQQIVWADRRMVDVGVRHEEYDRLYRLDPATYGSAGATWLLSDEPFFPRSRALSGLALHASYGVAGDSRPIAALLSRAVFFPPPGVFPGDVQPITFDVETVSEAEVGLVARAMSDRLRLDATWFRQQSTRRSSGRLLHRPVRDRRPRRVAYHRTRSGPLGHAAAQADGTVGCAIDVRYDAKPLRRSEPAAYDRRQPVLRWGTATADYRVPRRRRVGIPGRRSRRERRRRGRPIRDHRGDRPGLPWLARSHARGRAGYVGHAFSSNDAGRADRLPRRIPEAERDRGLSLRLRSLPGAVRPFFFGRRPGARRRRIRHRCGFHGEG